jgi:hypothetical protein
LVSHHNQPCLRGLDCTSLDHYNRTEEEA